MANKIIKAMEKERNKEQIKAELSESLNKLEENSKLKAQAKSDSRKGLKSFGRKPKMYIFMLFGIAVSFAVGATTARYSGQEIYSIKMWLSNIAIWDHGFVSVHADKMTIFYGACIFWTTILLSIFNIMFYIYGWDDIEDLIYVSTWMYKDPQKSVEYVMNNERYIELTTTTKVSEWRQKLSLSEKHLFGESKRMMKLYIDPVIDLPEMKLIHSCNFCGKASKTEICDECNDKLLEHNKIEKGAE